MDAQPSPIETFIARWQGREGGAERANFPLFIAELCTALTLPTPDPASATTDHNDYVFERRVDIKQPDGNTSPGRIDLYKRNAFILEAKQSRQPGGAKALPQQLAAPTLPTPTPAQGKRTAARAWDVMMQNARHQAESYARALPPDHIWPPFILVLDVGHVLEIYADFSGQGRNYAQHPSRQSFRIYLEDLRKPEAQSLLRAIWTDPQSENPARKSAPVTRDIAQRLAAVSKSLESAERNPEDAALFLMRCLFTMFAEDVGLLPEKSFKSLLQRCEATPENFPRLASRLWAAMDTGGFSDTLETQLRRFNGDFFKNRTAFPLGREELGELRRAAEHDWRAVDPSIFGTLLEQALDKTERKRLGAHYTPRAYVERLVITTIIEPLRADWRTVLGAAEVHKSAGRAAEAIATVSAFHQRLCNTRILDPACGTGNFLYVALELMKRLEGEILEALANLGGQETLTGLQSHTIGPHQFLGLEINPRAAAIAELVLWIGYLQWSLRTKGGFPDDPVLKAYHNITVTDAVLEADITLARDKTGKPIIRRTADGAETETYTYKKPRRPTWPEADFIIGNPPFIGGKDLRARLGDAHAEALRAAHPAMNDSADFVMYWWDHAADLLTKPKSPLRRFGFVTTNSITQTFQRRTIERHLPAKRPLTLALAIPDHPWTKSAPDAAAVRIAMTVAQCGGDDGTRRTIQTESGLDTDAPDITFTETKGRINADLSVGTDVTTAIPLKANEGVCSPGVKLHGAGFIVTPAQAEHLGLGTRPGLDRHIRPYRNGRDLTAHSRTAMVIDLDGLAIDEVRRRYPEVYQHLYVTVKPERDTNNEEYRRLHWWLFGRKNTLMRGFTNALHRYIVTVETAKHRIFQFLPAEIIPDNKLVAIGSDDAFTLGILSSRIHVAWAMRSGGWLGIGNDPVYVKSRCFDPFPFPAADDLQKHRIRVIAEELDAHRKRVLADHPHLTLTGLYNILDHLRAGTTPAALPPGPPRHPGRHRLHLPPAPRPPHLR